MILPLTVRQLDFRSGKDYAPVTQVAEFEFALAVGVNHPAKNLPEFIAWARANPNAASFGAPGGGGLPQLFGAMIPKTTGIELIYVAYKSAAPLAGALMGDQIASAMGALSDFIALHRAGKIRIIATTGTQRSAFAPEIATFREQGLANIVGTTGSRSCARANPQGGNRSLVDRNRGRTPQAGAPRQARSPGRRADRYTPEAWSPSSRPTLRVGSR